MSLSAASTNVRTAASSVTSVGTPRRGLFSTIRLPRRQAAPALRLQIATAQPSSSRACATALPMPRDAPVTTATLPRGRAPLRLPRFLVALLPRAILYAAPVSVKQRESEDGFGHQGPPRDRHRWLERHRLRDRAAVSRRRRARADHRPQRRRSSTRRATISPSAPAARCTRCVADMTKEADIDEDGRDRERKARRRRHPRQQCGRRCIPAASPRSTTTR